MIDFILMLGQIALMIAAVGLGFGIGVKIIMLIVMYGDKAK